MINDLLLVWIAGIGFSLMMNVLTMDRPEPKNISRFVFNIVFWPIAILILSFKGMLSHFNRNNK